MATASIKPKARVLLVDDDETVLMFLEKNFRDNGFETYRATTGKAGVESARKEKIDVIILDVLLPDFDGADVAGLLQDHVTTRAIPIIYLTALTPKEKGVIEGDLAPDNIFIKPVDVGALLAKVKEITKKKE